MLKFSSKLLIIHRKGKYSFLKFEVEEGKKDCSVMQKRHVIEQENFLAQKLQKRIHSIFCLDFKCITGTK